MHVPISPQAGMTLLEALVSLAIFTTVLGGVYFLLDFSRRTHEEGIRQMDADRAASSTLRYLVRSLRQASTGKLAENPTNCTACHADTDGALSDNPATDCPLDMTSPDPPLSVLLYDVDPADPDRRTPAEPGNGISYLADLTLPPADLNPVFAAERRTIYPVEDGLGDFWVLAEEEDHNRDGTPESVDSVAFDIRDLRFELARGGPPAWSAGTSVTPSCYGSSPGGCHGTGNRNAGGSDIYGTGVYDPNDPRGEVWQYGHPDSFSVRGIRITLTADSGRRTTLSGFAFPRGLDP